VCQVKDLKTKKESNKDLHSRKVSKRFTKRISLKELLSSPAAKILSPSSQKVGEEQAYSKAQFKIMLGEEREKIKREYDSKISELAL
jgi:hypothetical protein